MNEVEILNKIMQAFPQGSQGGNVVINIINLRISRTTIFHSQQVY